MEIPWHLREPWECHETNSWCSEETEGVMLFWGPGVLCQAMLREAQHGLSRHDTCRPVGLTSRLL